MEQQPQPDPERATEPPVKAEPARTPPKPAGRVTKGLKRVAVLILPVACVVGLFISHPEFALILGGIILALIALLAIRSRGLQVDPIATAAMPKPDPAAAPAKPVVSVHDSLKASRARQTAQMLCPHCQVRGKVTKTQVKVKKGISGGKATAAILTAGTSLLATGLSRKGYVTQARCGNCGTTWTIS